MLLDTHVVLWWAAGGAMLSKRARSGIRQARLLYVSPLSCFEIVRLSRKGRVALAHPPEKWIRLLFAHDRVEEAPVTPAAATEAGMLPDTFSGDPIDRLLYATAADLRVPIATRDRAFRQLASLRGDVRVIW